LAFSHLRLWRAAAHGCGGFTSSAWGFGSGQTPNSRQEMAEDPLHGGWLEEEREKKRLKKLRKARQARKKSAREKQNARKMSAVDFASG
jgi:hypothetical protein